jgi:hypothetical protein
MADELAKKKYLHYCYKTHHYRDHNIFPTSL